MRTTKATPEPPSQLEKLANLLVVMDYRITNFSPVGISSEKSKGGLSKGGLGPKGANWAKKGPFGAISALPPWVWGAEELGPIGPEKAPTGPEKVPISPEKARFPWKDFPPIFSENLGLKPPFVSPRLDFPNFICNPVWSSGTIPWENKGKWYTPQVRKEGYTP